MSKTFDDLLAQAGEFLSAGLDPQATSHLLTVLGGPPTPPEWLAEMKLYSETLPKGRENPYTEEQRCLHFLWDAFDKLPLALMAPFSIPFRRLIGERLFKRCGTGLVCEENVRFNFGQFLELGERVFFNRGVFLDTKGGLVIGDQVGLAEDVRIFTHGHSEASHIERTYAPVVINSFAKIYSGATIMPGVTIGSQAIVASGALVMRDAPANTVVAGRPAKVVRERRTEGRSGEDLDHIWLF